MKTGFHYSTIFNYVSWWQTNTELPFNSILCFQHLYTFYTNPSNGYRYRNCLLKASHLVRFSSLEFSIVSFNSWIYTVIIKASAVACFSTCWLTYETEAWSSVDFVAVTFALNKSPSFWTGHLSEPPFCVSSCTVVSPVIWKLSLTQTHPR